MLVEIPSAFLGTEYPIGEAQARVVLPIRGRTEGEIALLTATIALPALGLGLGPGLGAMALILGTLKTNHVPVVAPLPLPLLRTVPQGTQTRTTTTMKGLDAPTREETRAAELL